MILTDEQIKGIAEGKIVQISFLVNEGECLRKNPESVFAVYSQKYKKLCSADTGVLGIVKVIEDGSKYWYKFQVNKDYIVQDKNGEIVWWNTHHKTITKEGIRCRCPCNPPIPLRIRIKSIELQNNSQPSWVLGIEVVE